jgi:hypothetical protein
MAIAVARQMLLRAADGRAGGTEPPALRGAAQNVRAASVLLARDRSVKDWAREALRADAGQSVFSV